MLSVFALFALLAVWVRDLGRGRGRNGAGRAGKNPAASITPGRPDPGPRSARHPGGRDESSPAVHRRTGADAARADSGGSGGGSAGAGGTPGTGASGSGDGNAAGADAGGSGTGGGGGTATTRARRHHLPDCTAGASLRRCAASATTYYARRRRRRSADREELLGAATARWTSARSGAVLTDHSGVRRRPCGPPPTAPSDPGSLLYRVPARRAASPTP